MDIEHIKKTVQNAFSDVDSVEFLQVKLSNQVEAHKITYEKFKKKNPDIDFTEWKNQMEDINTKTNNNSEILAIGIYLLALDELKQPDD
ncbi:hypothetical protein ACNFU2_06595 [Chryseobacterium sp. PTM-20240506]|uniref:hypothetical protein n=1 Tax=Chryseobacterium sp. PTM-20240506 TaxID=3400631 RepID=UPI003AB0526C